jgi:hypothetical protein
MKVQLLRSKAGRIFGIAFTRRGIVLDHKSATAHEYVDRPKNICDVCGRGVAVVFCFGHSQCLCSNCIGAHNHPGHCSYASMARFRTFADRFVKDATSDSIM